LCKPEELLNSRTELLAKCIHMINFELRKAKKVPP
jgi:endonuclease III